MISEITVKNYQSHKLTSLELDPGVNIIVGQSDSGKTAIIRALRWLVWNRPGGDSFRSSWGGDTSIEINIDNNSIVRGKGKSSNEYKLNDLSFTAFGTEVPEEIQNILNINEINLQSQFDQPFLLTASPGEVAAHFNRIAHIDKIDSSIKKAQSWIRELEQEIQSNSKTLAKATEELQTFEYIPKAEVELEVLEGMESKLNQTRKAKNQINNQIKNICQVEENIKEKSEILKIEPEINRILSIYEKQEGIKIKLRTLQKLIESLIELREDILSRSNIIKAEKTVNNLLELIKEKQDKELTCNSLVVTLNKAVSTDKLYKDTIEHLKALTTRYNEEFPDVCPWCDQPVKKGQIHEC